MSPLHRIGGALLLALALACGGDTEPDATPSERVLQVEVAPAETTTSYAVRRNYVGQVEARRRSQVGFDLPGTLVSAGVDEGDPVAAGALLAALDTDRLRARRRELEAAQAQARTSRDLAASTLERVRRAASRNAVSAQDVDEAAQRHLSAEAALERTDAQIELIDVDLAKSSLRSPFPAIVARRFIDEGQVLAAGTPVFELLERERPRARIGVGPEVARTLSHGGTYAVDVRGREVEATLLRALPEQNASTRTVDLLFELDSSLEELRVGETASLAFDREVLEEGFWLPVSALTESLRGLWSCYVAVPLPAGTEATHTLEKRQLETLELDSAPGSGQPRAFVRGALASGDLVVTGGLQRLTPGQRVTVETVGWSAAARPPQWTDAAPDDATSEAASVAGAAP